MRPGPTARAAAVLAVFLALFLLVDRLSGQRQQGPVVASGTTRPGAATPPRSTAAVPPTTRAPVSTQSSTTTTPSTSTTREPAGTTGATGTTLRSAKGVTVQVLNGAFVPGLAHRVAEKIGKAGYEVVAANTALGNYTVSRIYYTSGHKADAQAFQARFPAFKQMFPASEAQASLSGDVALHAVVGQNYRDI